MDVIAVIPARGGSVGLPGKNIRPLLGVPLVARTVQTALQAKSINEVFVTSNDEDVLRISAEAGATVIRRPEELSNNTASSESALLHALEWIQAQGRVLPDYIVMLQCTSAFTRPEDIDLVLESIVGKGAKAALSVVEDHGFIWQEGEDGFAEGITHDHSKPRQRRQDMKLRYRENGAIYAMRVPSFLEKKERFCGPTVMVPVNGPTVEIDSQEDWEVVEAFLRALNRFEEPAAQTHKIKAVITDFDGVHTDDRVTVDQYGRESVTCSRRDGLGLELLRKRNVKLMVLSKEANPVVLARAEKLKMPVMNQIDDKLPVLDAWRQEQGLEWTEIVYIGNDVNDIDCMRICGLSFAPADAHPAALDVADRVLNADGGKGAVREMCDYLIAAGFVE
ncbi:acylneuraminate cytidylyltransferase [Stappia sp. BW2]|uniref:acylneuraminate cytidylyltransferase n=1 Tax=Stappia sp. BW2 TaxID=2592622 RepID=UPI0011DED229|nr:acylneuraminate cytidylyltransferase [Stappia sp. BW2]TYC67345.1 acylneuraminate cytidylyltransferase [Stappia sp. BW2]